MIRRVKRIKPKKRFTPVKVVNPEKTGDELEHVFLPPLAPRPRLFKRTFIVFGVWVVFLVAMYITTRFPDRFAKPTSRPAPEPLELPAPLPTQPATTQVSE